ncbi:hypothetical protein AFLA_013106 [Aspergillus flavus NRRL3357]|nr:hypothetical protein AFLA_013106 [Aspergillus flavus NRRL3357]
MSTTRYKDPIPDGVCVFTTLDKAAQIQKANPHAIFYPENNGHYAKDPDGTVVAVASDEIDRDYVPAYGAVGCNQTWCDESHMSLWTQVNISLILLEYQEEKEWINEWSPWSFSKIYYPRKACWEMMYLRQVPALH